MTVQIQSESFLLLFTEKNSDGTRKLRLKGKEFQQRFNDRIICSDLTHIGNFLELHPLVIEINLSYNNLGDDGLKILCDSVFTAENNLLHLNIMNCDITYDGILEFFHASKKGFMKLRTLRLTGNWLGPNGGHIVSLLIGNCPDFEYLDVGDTGQTCDSIDCICISTYESQIKALNCSRGLPSGLLQIENSTFIGESISELIRINKSLVEIHFQKCELDAHDIATIIMGLKLNKTLKFLDIAYNNACCVGVEWLADWLKTRPSVTALNIAGNNVKDHGATALAMSLPFSKIRLLDISSNHVSDNALLFMLQTVKKPYMLRYLYMWGNHIGPKSNKVLTTLLSSGALQQECIDVKVYTVDNVLYAARFPADKYKHRYYDVMDHGCAIELKIKRNFIEHPLDGPKALIDFKHIDRYLAVPNK